ncbi:MAG: hypothetical protein GWP33_10230 [Alphaproteobacteria bacterium]|nr:hypothetical protein [Alphaproteobacteria bacterium]
MSEEDFKDRVEKGWQVAEHVFGERPAEGQKNGVLSDMVMATAYADIWSRPGLGLRDRSVITCIVLAVQEHETELKVHLRGLAHQGVSRIEAEEMMMHISIYVGWPKALEARRMMTEVFDELEIS